MKRSLALRSLSQDHHKGLAASVRIKQHLAPEQLEATTAFVAALWDQELVGHFQREEEYLVPVLYTLTADVLARRMCREHSHLQQLAHQARTCRTDRARHLAAFAEQLRAHIRFEERILFPFLEDHLDAVALRRLGLQQNLIHG